MSSFIRRRSYDDVPEKYGIKRITDEEYTGKFVISYYTKQELILLQKFFAVRRNKFDMRLLQKRPVLLEKLSNEDIDN